MAQQQTMEYYRAGSLELYFQFYVTPSSVGTSSSALKPSVCLCLSGDQEIMDCNDSEKELN